jgi:predicted flap endonuclease-1-like 5' DNA nuclease
MEFIQVYWPVFLVALIIGVIVGYLVFRPRQSVRLSDSAPIRPHMSQPSDPADEGKNITDEAAAAVSDVAGQVLGTHVHQELPGASGTPDDLLKLKGVGPKLAAILNDRGITRFEQIAGLSEGQVEALDASLGAFRGRFERDRIVEQADYLSRDDITGYEAKFGKL